MTRSPVLRLISPTSNGAMAVTLVCLLVSTAGAQPVPEQDQQRGSTAVGAPDAGEQPTAQAHPSDTRDSRSDVATQRGAEPSREMSAKTTELEKEVRDLRQQMTQLESAELRSRDIGNDRHEATTMLLGLIGLLLGIVGLLIPLVTYLTAVLPGNRMVEEARAVLKGLDERFVELNSKHQNDLIEKAIKNLRHDADYMRQAAISFIAQNSNHDFSERQIFDICAAAREAPPVLRPQLLHAIAGRDSRYVTELIETLLVGQEGLGLVHPLARQWSATGAESLYLKLRDWLTTREMRHLAGAAATHLGMASPTLLMKLINDLDLLESLSFPQRVKILISLRTIADQYKLEGLADSELAAQLAGKHDCFFGSRGHEEEAPASEANLMIRYVDGAQIGVFQRHTKEFQEAIAALGEEEPPDEPNGEA